MPDEKHTTYVLINCRLVIKDGCLYKRSEKSGRLLLTPPRPSSIRRRRRRRRPQLSCPTITMMRVHDIVRACRAGRLAACWLGVFLWSHGAILFRCCSLLPTAVLLSAEPLYDFQTPVAASERAGGAMQWAIPSFPFPFYSTCVQLASSPHLCGSVSCVALYDYLLDFIPLTSWRVCHATRCTCHDTTSDVRHDMSSGSRAREHRCDFCPANRATFHLHHA